MAKGAEMSEEKPSWVIILEKEMEELEERLTKRVNELEKRIEEQSERMRDVLGFIILAIERMSATRVVMALAASAPPGALKEVIRHGIKTWKEVAENGEKILGTVVLEDVSTGIGILINAAYMNKLPFDFVASALLEEFGPHAKEAVRLEDITASYGVDAANKWKELVK